MAPFIFGARCAANERKDSTMTNETKEDIYRKMKADARRELQEALGVKELPDDMEGIDKAIGRFKAAKAKGGAA